MSSEFGNNEQKIDLTNLGQFYSPITLDNYCQSQASFETNDLSHNNQKIIKKKEKISCSPDIINKKTLKVKFEKVSNRINESFGKNNYNNSYNMSRNDNNMNENTTNSTMDEKNINSSIEEKSKMTKIKELMTCFLCHERVCNPRICPNCFKIACEECLKKWFNNKNNNKCFNCHHRITLEKMIFIPVINNISNILNKITLDLKNDSSLVFRQLNSKKTYNNLNKNRLSNKNNADSNRGNISCCTMGNLKQKSPNNSLDLRNCLQKTKHRKFPNSISETPFSYLSNNESIYKEHCPTHPDQLLFYYCVNCEKSYCRTCFVFFGQEKNNHIGHQILDYEKFKNKNNLELLKQTKDLKENNDKINFFINECEYLKNCYLNEKEIVNNYVKSFINSYNEKIDENIKKINDLIINYKNYNQQINQTRENIKKFYSNKNTEIDINEMNILNDIKKTNNFLYTNDIDNFPNLSPKFVFNIYQSELKHFDIIDNNFKFKAKLGNSKYNLGVLKKENEIQIYIYYLTEKEPQNKKSILPFVYLKRKDHNWELFELKESLTYNGHNYFIKRFNAECFYELNSYIKIKGILYENFFTS